MNYQYRPKSTLCERFDGFLVRLFLALGLSLTAYQLQAQDDLTSHILVLHGDFYESIWEREFDRLFSENLQAREEDQVAISFQYLGLDRLVSPVSRAFYHEHILEILSEKHVDMIVAVLPAAIEFVLEAKGLESIPKVLVLPSAPLDIEPKFARQTEIIESNSERALRKTLEAAFLLIPDVARVEFFSGAGQTDREYLLKAEEVAEAFSTDTSFAFTSGMNGDSLKKHLSGLNQDSVAILLPYASTSDGQVSNVSRRLPDIVSSSSIPVFSIVDQTLGQGAVGGFVYAVEQYANASSEAATRLRQGMSYEHQGVAVQGEYTFDYEKVSETGINLSLLSEPYVLVNQPRTIFSDYSGFVTTIIILGVLLSLAIIWQYVLLNRAKAAGLQLRESEKQANENQVLFESLINNTLDVIWIWDSTQRQATYCSPTIEQLTGYTSKEFLDLSIHEAMTSESASIALKKANTLVDGAQVFEVDLRKKNGELVCCEIAAQTMDDSLGKNQWVGITRDVSQRKKSEKEQLALQNQLRQSQKFESLGTLAGGIAHDFNNTLGTIMGLSELIKLRAEESPDVTAIADKLLTTTDRAKAMVGQILAFSRQSNSTKKAADLNVLVTESIQIMQTGIPKSVTLNVSKLARPAFVSGDSNQLSQVFISVLTNAYEAVDEQTGKIEVNIFESKLAEPAKFMHGELPAGSYLTVQITDNGEGLNDIELDKMFDPFYTTKELGNGMGLAGARGIVINHGGAIDINSQIGEGCSVSISLPLVEPITEPANLTPSQEPSSVKATILLVDDQKQLLETISLMLHELGHECICCSDPQQAIDCLANEELSIDLVITDYSMPGMSGLELREFSTQKRPETPVVIATGYSERVTQDEYLNQNPHLVLSKPFGFAEIQQMLLRTLK